MCALKLKAKRVWNMDYDLHSDGVFMICRGVLVDRCAKGGKKYVKGFACR